ncbi:MAG: Asp-tRNA(Asn)/Glu-tRNA(Gln) amidotransferase subunit GatA [Candidatus Peregrinibacteria bacterium]
MISTLLADLRSKKISAQDLVEQHLARITEKDADIGAFLYVNAEGARKRAKEMDASGDFSAPLAGIPMTLKDIIAVEGLQNTAGSKVLEGYTSPFSATVWKKLEAAGAILLGKVNTDEFTMGSSCENSAYHITKNPHDLTRVPGGSSGGSAAAVSAEMGVFSIGSDTGGSIRQPANFCGVVGIKPSYGRVSRSGCISYASSFDTIGPFAKTVEDAARVLSVMAGQDPLDATTPDIPVPQYAENISRDMKGKKIGLIKEFLAADGITEEIKSATLASAKELEKQGAILQEVSLPLTKYAVSTYYLLVKAEASTNMARYDGIRYGHSVSPTSLHELYKENRHFFGDEVKRAIMMGTYTLSAGYYDAYYVKAAKVRTLIRQEYEKTFEEVDALVAPVSPFPPFKIGEKIDDPLSMYLADIFTVTANLAGICGISVPTGFHNGLPTGVQILGKAFNEQQVFSIASALENR